ncbi:hypothetical protein [Roseomonas genomospecies 6]|uniref:Uncharacterized protein n=1 Tax=Roseomonas genomospecies 6 TaxID=214106 RepID=A0A9W7KNC5_9PROT|nr:hypothetical protein [Roseomonas genomospecies 6]KAA0675974.1 hypothetical protein DS843_29055 [Roseomonas genomospecies 6]
MTDTVLQNATLTGAFVPAPDAQPPKPRHVGNFFAIDARAWVLACALGLNAAIAYLILAAFSRRDNRTTCAGVEAVKQYARVGWSRAAKAIDLLETAGLVSTPDRPKLLRVLTPAHTIPECEGYPPEPLTDRERRLYDWLVPGGSWLPSRACPELGGFRPRTLIRGIVDKGWARALGGHIYAPVGYDPAAAALPAWIWLPRSLVVGAGGDTPPIVELRQAQSVGLLRLFVQLYGVQDLAEDGGLPWTFARYRHTKLRVGDRGRYVVVAFGNPQPQFNLTHPLVQAHANAHPENPTAGLAQFKEQLNRLIDMGLVEVVDHLIESLSGEAEILHPCPRTNGNVLERKVAQAADAAARALLPAPRIAAAVRPLGASYTLVPVPSVLEQVELIGILRLRYRAWTRRTAAWSANTKERCQSHLQQYERMLATVRRGHPTTP